MDRVCECIGTIETGCFTTGGELLLHPAMEHSVVLEVRVVDCSKNRNGQEKACFILG